MSLLLRTPEDTAKFGGALAHIAKAGDCFLLRGQIGAGKSALARAFIRTLLGPDTEVPSPTFTLVQIYEQDGRDAPAPDIWHADLYRLSDPHEAVELGLTDAFEDQICLVEWPELLGDMTPDSALDIHLRVERDYHRATVTFDETWRNRVQDLELHA